LTETERAEKVMMKINDMLGNINVVYVHFESNPEDGKTKLHWKTDDQGEIFEHKYEYGWEKDKKK
jgi:hypothetical protein